MKPYLVALVCVCALMGELAAASSSSSAAERSNALAWRRFKRQHGKVYEGQEDARRFANFLAKKQLVESHNANPRATYQLELNHMSDWSAEEVQRLKGFRMDGAQKWVERSANDLEFQTKLAKLVDGPVPDEVDWRKVPNRVTPVKDQMQCGSCWAFATTGVLEGQQAVRNFSKLIPLSEQELVDCSPSNYGCDGGIMAEALDDISKKLGGEESETDYAYEGDKGQCRINKSKFVMVNKANHVLPQNDEQVLKKVVANYGPVAVAFDAEDRFMTYKSGVIYDPDCSPRFPNHAVLIVGYGHDDKAGDYWLVKNSWNTSWGEDGYFKIVRGINMCGISMFATVADF